MTIPKRWGKREDDVASVRNTLTGAKATHTFKFGGWYLEYMQNANARRVVERSLSFNRDPTISQTQLYYANALLGSSLLHERIDREQSSRPLSSGSRKTTWRPRQAPAITCTFLGKPGWRPMDRGEFGRIVRHGSARPPPHPGCMRPARQRSGGALNKITGAQLAPVFIGAFVPGTGSQNNGLVLADGRRVPRASESRWRAARAATGVRLRSVAKGDRRQASAGMYQNARLGGGSGQPCEPTVVRNRRSSTADGRCWPRCAAPDRPATERARADVKTPGSKRFGRRSSELGCGTVVD